MRLKVTSYQNTKSTVFALALWDSELHKVSGVERYLEVVNGPNSVVDKLHALLLLANQVESSHAPTSSRQGNKTEGGAGTAQQSEAVSTEEPLSIQV